MRRYQMILFDVQGANEPTKCYKVGLLGCKKIEEQYEGITDNIHIFSYNVYFTDGSTINVKNTLYVSD